ncbi:hypothetical protein H2199_008344 [Coniosporium tulheliwenetii]|uniref:Uncharacterized protein n=1 Tax=Coniosporium tulheliwenetii TaxID=3383036 RepID=A0ACC2YKS9_9PEZI|nr:hypothetical protein H2199_008344 [Cladosporium sp. JES 115]
MILRIELRHVFVPLRNDVSPTPQRPRPPLRQNLPYLLHLPHSNPTSTPFGYDYFLSLPPSYDADPTKQWPLVLFLHGAGESQRGPNESYATLRHGVPKIILCYDRLKDGKEPSIEIPLAARLRGRNPNKGRGREDADKSVVPVPKEVCDIVAEEFITVTPSLDMGMFGLSFSLSAFLRVPTSRSIRPASQAEDISILTRPSRQRLRLERPHPLRPPRRAPPLLRADPSRLHVTGFSMGGYGTWSLGLHSPDRFASLVPICGGGDSILAKNIKHIPQWVHHGELDDIIPISQSVKMVSALERAQRGWRGGEGEIYAVGGVGA